VLDRRAAGHPDGLLELGRDDHRQGGLAQPGRAARAARGPVAAPRRRAASSTSPSWSRTRGCPGNSANRRGRSAASTPGRPRSPRVHHPGGCLVGPVRLDVLTGSRVARLGHGRSTCRAARSKAATEVGVTGLRGHPLHRVLGLFGSPAQPDERLSHRCPPGLPPGRVTAEPAPAAGAAPGMAPTLSRNSSTRRSAPFTPMPGTSTSAPCCRRSATRLRSSLGP
jgi:hypothetical protein